MEKSKELSPYEKIIRNRIIKLINEYCDGSQKRFVERTGINQGSVSQYVNGKNSPSWDNAEKIAAAFNIDVKWVMAVDAIPDGADQPEDTARALSFIEKFDNAAPEIQKAIASLLGLDQSDL